MRASYALVLLSASLFACSGGGSDTRIVVVVGSDYAVPAELDTIRVNVTGAGPSRSKDFSLTAASSLPVSVDLVPSDNKAEPFAVTVMGLRGGLVLVTQEARLSFLPGEARLLSLFLGRACKGIACDANHTCSGGRCDQLVDVAPTTLPLYDPKHLPNPSGPDGGQASGDVGSDAIGAEPGQIWRGDGAIGIDGTVDSAVRDAVLDQPLPPPGDADAPRSDVVAGTGGGVSVGTGGSGGGGAGGVRGSGGVGGMGGAGTGGVGGGTSTGPVVLVGGLVTVSNPVLGSGSVRLVDHGLERMPPVCGPVGGKTVCLSGGIAP